jgi:hypothetical protein
MILVLTEGTKTEPQYLSGIVNSLKNPRVSIQIAKQHGVPVTLIREAKSLKDASRQLAESAKDHNLAYDAVWCVFDVDDHLGISNVKEMARDNGIELAISNPCFELWLLLHFRESPGMQHRQKIVELLRQNVAGYVKDIRFDLFAGKHIDAKGRARRLDHLADACGEPGQNPTTGVYRLIEAIEAED